MIAFIYICILALNIVAVLLTYKFLGKDIEKKEKGIFIIIGIAIMYVIVNLAYWIGTHDIAINVSDDIGKNLMVFTFVPVNSIIVLPFLASSYKYYKEGRLKPEVFRNRVILLAVILIVVFIFEIFYFKDIQLGILNMLSARK